MCECVCGRGGVGREAMRGRAGGGILVDDLLLSHAAGNIGKERQLNMIQPCLFNWLKY